MLVDKDDGVDSEGETYKSALQAGLVRELKLCMKYSHLLE